MDAVEQTNEWVVRVNLPMSSLVKNTDNPNKMSSRQFDLLVENIERTGMTDPLLVRPIEGDKYRIVGGHHRFEAAEYLGFTEMPCTIITDPAFDEEAEQFQMVRMNVIHGQMDPEKFVKLYNQMSAKYADDMLQEMFGFADEAMFQNLIKQTKESLPPEMQEEFAEAAKEIKTIEDLASVLNHMISTFGDTLDYGYMILDFGGKDSVWLRMQAADMTAFKQIATSCKEKNVTVDSVFRALMCEVSEGLFEDLPKIEIPEVVLTPTEEELAKEI